MRYKTADEPLSKNQTFGSRDIGWKLWDPIVLGLPGEDWPEHCADEYDRYLLHDVGMLNQGNSPEDAAEYLEWVGSEYMGLGPSNTLARKACVETVQGIIAYLQDLPEVPLNAREWPFFPDPAFSRGMLF